MRRRMRRSRVPRFIRKMPIDDQFTSRFVKLRFAEVSVIAAGSSNLATVLNSYRANSIYDPRANLGGNPVFDYSRWAALYNHYSVHGSKITYRISHISDISGMVFCTKLDDDNTAFTAGGSYALWEGDKNVKIRFLNLTPYTTTGVVKIVRKFSPKKFFDLKFIDDNDSHTATMGNNPSEQAYFCAAVQQANLVSDHVSFTLHVTIEYLVKLSEPKDIYNTF